MLVNISDNHPGFSQFEVDNALLSLNGTPVPIICLYLPLPVLVILYHLPFLVEVYSAQISL